MNFVKTGLAVGCFVILAGCSGVNYAMENYRGVPIVQISYDDQLFRVFDKPAENRLMITPSLGAAMVEGATFGAGATPEFKYKMAAQAYLDSTGRDCVVGDMMLIASPQYETFYTCS